MVRNWKPVRSLVGDALSGAEFAPFRLWLAPACPLCLAGDGPARSQLALLWYLLSPLFSEQAQHCLGLELFAGKFSLSLSLSFSLSGYPTVWVSISL